MKLAIYFLRLFIPLAVLLAILIRVGYMYHVDTLHQRLIDDNRYSLASKKAYLGSYLSSAIADIFFLGNSDIPLRVQENPDTSSAAFRDLTLFSKAARRYDQLRILDTTGLEFIRINYLDGQAVITPPGELQDKGRRFYVLEARQLRPEEMYISPLDLNMEYGEVELPYKPMIRLIMQIGEEGNRGYLVGNILLNDFLDQLGLVDSTSATSFMLLNDDGYWLQGPEEYRSFGFMFPDMQQENMQSKFGDEWEYMQQHKSGAAESDVGLFIFEEIDFISLFADINYLNDSLLRTHEDNNFIVASYISPDKLDSILDQDRKYFYLTLVFAIILSAVLALVRAKAVHKDNLAQERLKQEKVKLKKLVNQLTKRNSQLKEFSQIVSHNLRNPVTNLGLLTELLHNSKTPPERDVASKNLMMVSHALREMVNDLSDTVSNLNTDNLRLEECSLPEILTKVKRMVKVDIEATHTTIESDFSAWDTVLYPYIYLESIILNFCTNAIKYRDYDRAPVIKIRSFYAEGNKALSVEDNGIGIDLEQHQDAVFMLHKRFQPDRPGKGIGLFMTKTQIESMGGKISVASEVGKGTMFTVVLEDNTNTE
ncbi:MAG: HAMP domain-containing sensor histidine kinase [Cyclobacteriaceae bacterium]